MSEKKSEMVATRLALGRIRSVLSEYASDMNEIGAEREEAETCGFLACAEGNPMDDCDYDSDEMREWWHDGYRAGFELASDITKLATRMTKTNGWEAGE